MQETRSSVTACELTLLEMAQDGTTPGFKTPRMDQQSLVARPNDPTKNSRKHPLCFRDNAVLAEGRTHRQQGLQLLQRLLHEVTVGFSVAVDAVGKEALGVLLEFGQLVQQLGVQGFVVVPG